MSDSYLKVFPTDPQYMPDRAHQEWAAALVETWVTDTSPPYPDVISTEVETIATDRVRFIDQGMNLIRISCPSCGSELSMGWWERAMAVACDGVSSSVADWTVEDWLNQEELGYGDLSVVVPCCKSQLSLNDLVYDWPAGFARFSIEVLYPERELIESEVEMLEKGLGCKLKQIWARY